MLSITLTKERNHESKKIRIDNRDQERVEEKKKLEIS